MPSDGFVGVLPHSLWPLPPRQVGLRKEAVVPSRVSPLRTKHKEA